MTKSALVFSEAHAPVIAIVDDEDVLEDDAAFSERGAPDGTFVATDDTGDEALYIKLGGSWFSVGLTEVSFN